MFRIAANEMASLMRSRSRRRDRESLAASRGEIPADGGPLPTADASASTIFAVDRRELLAALAELPERYQEVISLRFLSDLSAAETAAALGTSRGNVAVLLHRAVSALRTNLEDAR